MTRLLRQRSRIVRVRKIQHGIAAGAAAEAAGKVQMLETSKQRLSEMRGELRPCEGATTGASLARMGELAMRLDTARLGLGRSLDNARALAVKQEGLRLSARRDQESAQKLEEVAASAAADLAERQMLRAPRRPARFLSDGGDQ